MDRRQLFVFFFCSLIPWTMGYGILPLLPVYAAHFGASSSAAGTYLAISYVALTLGTLVAGWISDHLRSRKGPLIAAGVASIPLLWLAGQVPGLWELTAVTCALWFLGGMEIAITSILAGLSARKEQRGRIFGLLTVANPLGLLVGGLASGPIADRWGFPVMFDAFAIFSLLLPVAALMVQDKAVASPSSVKGAGAASTPGLGRAFVLLFLASLAAMIGNFVSLLARSLAMKDLGFDAAAISSTGAMGGIVTLPLVWVVGSLSDRLGRKGFLASSYLAAALGLGLLAVSASLWQFWIAVSLMYVQNSVNRAVGSALVADLVLPAALGRGMSLFTATTWLGGVIGFAATGFAIQSVGYASTLFMALVLPLAAAALLIPIRIVPQPPKPTAAATIG